MPIIQIHKLHKNWGSHPVLQEISLSIEKGDFFGIIGKSGSGKSTLLRCMSSLDSSFTGTISLLGHSLPCIDPKQRSCLRKQIGFIFQDSPLLENKTVLSNVCLPLSIQGASLSEQKQKGEHFLNLVGLLHKAHAYPSMLSGGEKQRVCIARALLSSPSVLFCDEPTSALDPKTKKEILTLLQTLHRSLSLTILFITHEMELIRLLCNKVAVLDAGHIVEEGPVRSVFHHPKNPLTQELLQQAPHDCDLSSLHSLFRLHFPGICAKQPILSRLISELHIEVNILSGWIDTVQGESIGCLTVSMQGERIEEALCFLQEAQVFYERISL